MSDRDYEDTVRWLSRARELERRIELRSEQAERLRQSLMPGAAKANGMPRGGGADWTDRVAAVMEVERDITDEIHSLKRAREEIVRAIGEIRDSDQRAVLDMRYIGGLKIGDIANRLHYGRTWVWRLHRQGVTEVRKKLQAKQNCEHK